MYLDVLLLTNFLMAYFLLLAAGRSAGSGRVRADAGGQWAGGNVVAYFVCAAPALLGAGRLQNHHGAGYHGGGFRLAQQTAAGYGGLLVCSAEYRPGGGGAAGRSAHRHAGSGYGQPDGVSARFAAAFISAVGRLLRRSGSWPAAADAAGRPDKTVGLEFELCGQPIRLRAAPDTGCHLRDPITCLPVLVVSYPDAKGAAARASGGFLEQWFAGATQADPPPGARLRLVPCGTAADRTLLPGFAVPGIGLITEKGVLGLGRSAVVFAPRSFGSTAYEALYGNDFL